MLGRHQEALEASERAIALDPRSAFAWHINGAALKALGRLSDAAVSTEKARGLGG